MGGSEIKPTEGLDIARYILGRLGLLATLLLALPLLIVGFLGGRGWWGRVAWAAVPLALAAGLLYAAAGPVFQAVAVPRLSEGVVTAAADATPLEHLLASKGDAVVQTVANDFMGGLATLALLALVLAVAALIAAIVVPRLARRGQRARAETKP